MRKTTIDYSVLAGAFELYAQERYFSPERQEQEREVTVSPEFEARMEKLIRRQNNSFFVVFNTAGKRVAAVIVALLVGLAVTTFSVKALREPFVRFITEVFEKFTSIVFVQAEEKGVAAANAYVFEKAEPEYLPDGYEVGSVTETDTFYTVKYTHASLGGIRYRQQLNGNTEMNVDTESTMCKRMSVEDRSGVLYANKDTLQLVLCDGEYRYYIAVPASLGEEELLRIAESIKTIS